MKNQKLKFQITIVIILVAIATQSCTLSVTTGGGVIQPTSTPGEIPTWTPRPDDLTKTALPTPTDLFDQTQDEPATVSATVTATPSEVAVIEMTPRTVTVTITGGNLNVRRGPSLAYNYVSVLYDGDVVRATGRDRISRWIRVELPTQPGEVGWITTETKYTDIEGDISNLPFIQTEPASPAFIRNCLPHEIWIMPADVYLLPDYEKPYNEERFNVGMYQVYDLENPDDNPIEDVNLSEGETVEILYDWSGERSKCE